MSKRGESVGKMYLLTIMLVVTTLLLILCSCGTVPQEQKIMNSVQWENSIWNKDNADFIDEVAFNEDVLPSEVTQAMFDARYSGGY